MKPEKYCRGCGASEAKRQAALARGAVNCCPDRGINDVIEENHGIPSTSSDAEAWKND